MLGLLVRIQDDLPRRAADIPDRQRDRQLAALGLGQLARQHPLPDQVQLCLAHRPLQPQQQPVVVKPRIIDAVRVGQQHPGQRAQLQQLVPVPAGPRQPGHLDAQHDAHTSHRDLGDQPGKARPGIRRRRRHPRSSSITTTRDRAQPSAAARSASAYCSRVDSECSRTCCLLDWRTYTTAARSRCSGRIFSCDWPHGRYLPRLITPASRRAGRCPGRQQRQHRHRRSPPLRRQHHPDPELGSHRSPGIRSHLAHLPQPAAGRPWSPPATALPRSLSPWIQG